MWGNALTLHSLAIFPTSYNYSNTGVPCFLKVCANATLFFWKTYIGTTFDGWKKFEEYFCFYEKSWKEQIQSRIYFAVSHWRGSDTRAATVAPPSSCPEAARSFSSSDCHSFELCLWAWVLSLSLLLFHSLVRSVLCWLLLHFMPFGLMKGFIGTLYFR